MNHQHDVAAVKRWFTIAARPRLFLLIGIYALGQFPNIMFAQPPDTLKLNNGNTLSGYIAPVACAAKPGDQQLSFQPVGGLPAQTPALNDILSIRVGNFVLDASDATTRPAPDEIVVLRGYLHTKSRAASTAAAKTLSISLALKELCDPPKPKFTGNASINGTASFAAQVQRLIGGTFYGEFDPAVAGTGSVVPIIQLSTSYGDAIKGSVTTKTSQIFAGNIDLQVQLPARMRLNLEGDEYHSFSQGVHLEQGYGAGISQNLGGSLIVEGDLWYVREDFYKPATPFSSPGFRFYETNTWFYGKRFVLFEDFAGVAPFDSARALFFRGEGKLAIKLGSATQPFSFNVTYDENYFRDSPKGYKQNYSKVTVGVTYNW